MEENEITQNRRTYPNSVLASKMSSLFSNHNKKVTRANQIPANQILFILAITAFNNQPITITFFHQIKSADIVITVLSSLPSSKVLMVLMQALRNPQGGYRILFNLRVSNTQLVIS